MASTHDAALAFFELTTGSGETVVTPIACPEMAWLGTNARGMARKMSKAVQEHLINKGRYLEALQVTAPWPLERHEIEVDLPAGPDPLTQPARRVRHVAFLSPAGDLERCIGVVPAVGVVALAEPERLKEAVAEAVLLEHRRSGRQADVRKQVAAQWFEQVELHEVPLALEFHGAEALRQLQEQRAEPLLRQIGEEMDPGRRPAIGLDETVAALSRAAEGSFARSVLVVGAEGSGKTALIQQYVRTLRRRGRPLPWETTAARLIQGLTRDGGWQHALAVLWGELVKRDVILYVGHLAELFEVGQYQGNAVSLGDALREPLARGRLMLLAEATPEELSRIELRSPGFGALFQVVRMPELPEAQQERVIVEAVAALASGHGVEVPASAVGEVIALQRRFSPYSGFPGKSIRFFEELVLHVRGRVKALGRDEAIDAFCAETGMPRRMLDPRLPLHLPDVQAFFRRRLFGQPDALDVVVGLLAATKTGLARMGKPIASMLLIGPTGVGKTETAKALAEFMFGDPRRMVRFDMSEYADPAAVLRLLGDLGQEEGVLIGAVRRQPFSVVLFDELEKAHPSFFDLLLQVLGEGRLTGGGGLTANFCGTFVLMTSNLGAEVMQRAPMGMVGGRDDPRRHFEHAVQEAFRPELYNRIDHIVPFAALTAAQRAPIFEREMTLMRQRDGLLERNAQLDIAPEVAQGLARLPGDPRYGARDVQRVMRRQLVLPLAHALAPHAHVAPLAVRVDVEGESALAIKATPRQQAIDTTPLLAADALADARRHWQKVTEGPLFVNLVNQVFRLDKERQRHEKKRRRNPALPHWDMTEPAQRMRELAAVQAESRTLFDEVIALEGQALLVLAGESADVPDVAAWRSRFLAFLQRAFHAMRPDSGVCTVGVYAAPRLIGMLRDEWCEVARRAGFSVTVQVVRMGDDPPKKAVEDGEPPPSAYLKFRWPQVEARQSPIVGFEIEMRGPAVHDYFRLESGMWRIFDDDRKLDAWVAVRGVELRDFRTPDNVHRQHFFDSLAVHRQVKHGQLTDPHADWHCAFPDTAAWKQQLDRQFEALMGRMLLGEES
jgi:MoxR-like ATPase